MFNVLILLLISEIVKVAHGQGGIELITTTPPLIILTPAPPATTTSNAVVIINPTTTPCQCTATTNCADGSGTLNPRIVNNNPQVVCAVGQVYCCNLIVPIATTVPPVTIAPATCGIRPNIANSFLPGAGQVNQIVSFPFKAAYAAYPWTALIFRVADNALIGTGVLIDANTVLTAAHKVSPATQVLRVRLGEYIINAVTEPNPLVEIAVSAIRIHEAYNAVNLVNDIAVLKLATAIDFNLNPHIRSACLPAVGAVYTGQRCWVGGFGASSFASNQYQTTMRQVDVPILDGPTCQTRFAASRLGATFVFNQQAFICAGGETSRDACTGDGGAGLMCLTGTQWFLAGLVSWGLDCGQTNIPGAYVNIANYLAWITTNRV